MGLRNLFGSAVAMVAMVVMTAVRAAHAGLPAAETLDAAALYQTHCAACHGADRTGSHAGTGNRKYM